MIAVILRQSGYVLHNLTVKGWIFLGWILVVRIYTYYTHAVSPLDLVSQRLT